MSVPAPIPNADRLAPHVGRPSVKSALWDAWHAKSWDAVADVGRVVKTRERGWHIEFRSVWWPQAKVARRVRVTHAEGYGDLKTEAECLRVLDTIREKHRNRPLCDVLAEYLTSAADMVPARYESQFLAAKAVALERGEIKPARYRALVGLQKRGYLEWWKDCAVQKVDSGSVQGWFEWLRQEHGHLGDASIRHLIRDFRAFCGHMRRVGALKEMPEFPTVRVRKKERSVPDRESLAKILEQIPEESRGLFLARSYAGLRPEEARMLDVRDYKAGSLHIRAQICKTGEDRYLPLYDVAPELASWIERHRKGASPWEPLFKAPKGRRRGRNAKVVDGRWRTTAEWNYWAKACAAAGFAHVAPNLAGRHHFITHEITVLQTDPWAVKDFAGHSSIQTTMNYTHADTRRLARRMRPMRKDPAKEA